MKGIGMTLNPSTLDLHIKIEKDSRGKIESGLTLGKTLFQNQALILNLHHGELKEHPLLGCGIADILNDDDLLSWKRDIALQLEADDMVINKIEINDKGLIIDADYSKK